MCCIPNLYLYVYTSVRRFINLSTCDKTIFTDGKEEDFLLFQALAAYPFGKELQKKSEPILIELYAEEFIFFLDGVDELGEKFPIFKLYNADKWSSSLFVITARTGFFSDRYFSILKCYVSSTSI